jgi:organic hydroperoxide reductase OsmC/OhrA
VFTFLRDLKLRIVEWNLSTSVRLRPVPESAAIGRSSGSGHPGVSRLTERPGLLLIRPADPSFGPHATGTRSPINPQLDRAQSAQGAAMTTKDIAAALQRVESVLKRRPAAGIHDDAPATARWQTGLRVVARDANGTQIVTDMPAELGGSGDQVTPGWLFRAGLASCLATRIAIGAATAGIELTLLEVMASSRTDARGLLGIADVSGDPVAAAPRDVQLLVRIAAPKVSAQELQALVESSNRCSPISEAARHVVPVALRIEVEAA